MKQIYASVIVNEKGHLVEYVSDLTGDEIITMLAEHPEYSIRKIAIAMSDGDIEASSKL